MENRSNVYQIGRLWAIAEAVAPTLTRHFGKFLNRPQLLLAQMGRVARVRKVWEINGGNEIFELIDASSPIPQFEASGEIVAGYYHQQSAMARSAHE